MSQETKQDITDLCVKYCAMDPGSFNSMIGRGFQQVAQGLINVGAEHGPVDVKKVLPQSSTMSRKTSAVAQQGRNESSSGSGKSSLRR